MGEDVTVKELSNTFVRLYSYGKEKEYRGTEIEYFDEYPVLLFFYYSTFTRVYVINGMKEERNLVQVNKKINVICVYDNLIAKRFIRFFNLAKDSKYFFLFLHFFTGSCQLF